MVLIQKVEINGFKTLTSKLSVMLSGSNISVIYGDNGSGKTTFLKILHSILEKDESALIQNKVSSVIIYYSYPDGNYDRAIIKRTYDSSKRSDLSKQNDNTVYYTAVFLSSPLSDLSLISLGVERGVVIQALRIDPRQMYDYFTR